MNLEFTAPQMYQNTSTHGVILTDCLLDTNKSHIESKLPESSPCTGRVKIKGIRMRQSYTLGGICEREKIPSPWEPLRQLGDQLGRRGFRGLAESQQLAWSRQNRLRPALMVLATASPSLRELHLRVCTVARW